MSSVVSGKKECSKLARNHALAASDDVKCRCAKNKRQAAPELALKYF
jgi:hypothetical protein